ncbi:transglycosylase SLT domain-containing protein [Streptomyces sp. AK02-01A]|uniref:aggregation-promoting factor C-terminal-like domain-containing protein n=1 Tax=Streptomyces sp. AK02-01A TaxID=3028648 RepID=UPI0029C9B6B2|nr:transglycosylase SLT domain-containing protein [Streptomyces sp. AK02-01A]
MPGRPLRPATVLTVTVLFLATPLCVTQANASPSVSGSNRAIAANMLSPAQYRCLNRLWTRESGWNHRAGNPRSGAYGIPQAYPAHKMASAGPDWRTNPRTQIRWGLKYIKTRYKTPCRAWSFWQRNNWY